MMTRKRKKHRLRFRTLRKKIPTLKGGMQHRVEGTEQRAIRLALEKTQGKVLAAAGLLGVSRRTIWRKLRKYKIDPTEFRPEGSKPRRFAWFHPNPKPLRRPDLKKWKIKKRKAR